MTVHAFHEAAEPVIDHALALAARGWHVFPCNPVNKRPLTDHGCKDATADCNLVRRWWGRWPNALIGVRAGSASGFFAIDPDVPKEPGAPDGLNAWRALVAERGGIPHTHTHETPSGGLHVLFKWDPDRHVTNSPGRLPKGIDVRGEGGYIIAPPSRLANGRSYRIAEPLDYFTFADAPDWLYEAILAKKAAPGKSPPGANQGSPTEKKPSSPV